MSRVISHFLYKLWLAPELWLPGVPLSSQTTLICPPNSFLKTPACSSKSHTRLTVRSLLTLPLPSSSFSYCVVSTKRKGRLLMLQGAGKNQHQELYLLHRCSQMYDTKNSIKAVWLQNGSVVFLMPVQACKSVLHCKEFAQKLSGWGLWDSADFSMFPERPGLPAWTPCSHSGCSGASPHTQCSVLSFIFLPRPSSTGWLHLAHPPHVIPEMLPLLGSLPSFSLLAAPSEGEEGILISQQKASITRVHGETISAKGQRLPRHRESCRKRGGSSCTSQQGWTRCWTGEEMPWRGASGSKPGPWFLSCERWGLLCPSCAAAPGRSSEQGTAHTPFLQELLTAESQPGDSPGTQLSPPRGSPAGKVLATISCAGSADKGRTSVHKAINSL